MKQIFLLLFATILLAGCSSVHYTKIDKKQPLIASVNMKDTSLTFFNTP